MSASALAVSSVGVSAAVAAGVTLALAGIALIARLALGGRRPHDAVAAAVGELNARMETMSRELADVLERAREETRRTMTLGDLAGSIDFDEVLGRTLEAAGALPGVDGALIDVLGPDDDPVTAATGISPEEAEEYALGAPPSGRRVRAVSVSYHGPDLDDSGSIAAALAVPIHGRTEPLGLISIFVRSPTRGFGDSVADELEALALRAGPALGNARRFKEARHLADMDALTGLHNRRYFHETLAREVARAHRYARQLALVVFDLDDFKAINDRVGHLGGDSVLAEVADRMRAVVRHSDVACRVGGDEFAVILPESTLADAEQLYERIQSRVRVSPLTHGGSLGLSGGAAELRPREDPLAFFQRADANLYRAKDLGKGRVASDDQPPVAPPENPRSPDLTRTGQLKGVQPGTA